MTSRETLVAVAHEMREIDGGNSRPGEVIFEEVDVDPRWPPPMASEAFQGVAGEFVERCSPHTEADRHALLVQFLVAIGAAIGTGTYLRVGATHHCTNEFALIVGQTAKARKGTAWAFVEWVIEAADSTLATRSGLTSGEGLIHHIRDASEQTHKDTGKPMDAGVTDKRLLVVETEFAGPLAAMKREGSTLSPVLRDAWDGRTLTTLGKRQPERATDPHVAVIGHITETELRAKLDSTETANGFANRFLFVASRRSQILPLGGDLSEDEFDHVAIAVRRVIEWAANRGEIDWGDEARELWCEVYEPLSAARPGLLGMISNRAEAHTIRLALIYALLDRSEVIKVPHLKAALAVWHYCADTVAHLFGDQLGDRRLDKALNLLRDNPDGMTDTELHEAFSRNVSGRVISEQLVVLGLARRFVQKSGGRGRPVYRTVLRERRDEKTQSELSSIASLASQA